MKIEDDVKLNFDDVLIKPKRSINASRADVNLHRTFHFKNGGKLECIPIIAANMDTTGSVAMSEALSKLDCLTALHKFYEFNSEFNQQIDWSKTFYTLGINDNDLSKFKQFRRKFGTPQHICIDVANGYMQTFVEFCRSVADSCPYSTIMAGNVATAEMTQELIINGKVDIVKVGIGPGSVCTTRLKTGVGYPQLSAIAECADVAHGLQAYVCADGGCREPNHVCKAFGAGADFVMLGSMLAGTDECEGIWEYYTEDIYMPGPPGNEPLGGVLLNVQTNEKKALKFHGMSSREAMEQHGGWADYKAAEGIEITVPYKGKAEEVVKDILGSLRSSCSLIGAKSLKDHPKCCTFIRVNSQK